MIPMLILTATMLQPVDTRAVYFTGDDHSQTLNFLIASASREQDIRRTALVPQDDGTYLLSLASNRWGLAQWREVMQAYPYATSADSYYVDGDWLITQLSDASESDAYYLLLFGRVPADEADYFQLLGVDVAESRKYSVGLIETSSRVVLSKVRKLEFMPTVSGYATVSRDYLSVDATNTPFETVLDHDAPSDASENIDSLPKVWGTGRGNLQAYFLSDANRKLLTEASVKVARDLSNGGRGFRNVSSVRVPGSCMSCHAEGLNSPSENGLKTLAVAGVEIFSESYEIERFHFTDLTKTIRRANEDFAEAVVAVNGLTPSENITAFHLAVGDYDADLSLEDVAAELGLDAEQLQLAIGYASEKGLIEHPNIISLGHRVDISRAAYEQLYFTIRSAVETWLKVTKQSNGSVEYGTSCWPVHLQGQLSLASVTLGNQSARPPSESANQPRTTGRVLGSESKPLPKRSPTLSSPSSNSGGRLLRRRRRR